MADISFTQFVLEPFAKFFEELYSDPNGYPWKDHQQILKGLSIGQFKEAYVSLSTSPSDYRERVRREAFEEAAKVCEEGDFDSEMKIYGRAFAELIRALGDSNADE